MKTTQSAKSDGLRKRNRTVRDSLDACDKLIAATAKVHGMDLISALRQLIGVLEDLGPVFSHFGRYLGSRPDCFPLQHCLMLRETGHIRPPSGKQLSEALPGVFGEDPGTAGGRPELNYEAGRSNHLSLVFTKDLDPDVLVTTINPEFARSWPAERELLDLTKSIAGQIWPRIVFQEVVSQFRREVEIELDLSRQLAWFKQRTGVKPELTATSFTTPEIAEAFDGDRGMQVRTPGLRSIPSPAKTTENSDEVLPSNEIAKRLCCNWFYHVLNGEWFPTSPSRASLGLDEAKKITFCRGTVASLIRSQKGVLTNYLVAVASERPDEATDIMLDLLRPGEDAGSIQSLKEVIRQAVPFREGGNWDSREASDSFAEDAFLQWRLAHEFGYRAPEELIQFFRGFFEVAYLARKLAPEHDYLREAISEIRWINALLGLRELFTTQTLSKQAFEWVDVMLQMPEKMNAAASGDPIARSYHPPHEESGTASSRNGSTPLWIAISAHLLVMAANAALLLQLADTERLPALLVVLGFGAFVVVGSSLLRTIRQGR